VTESSDYSKQPDDDDSREDQSMDDDKKTMMITNLWLIIRQVRSLSFRVNPFILENTCMCMSSAGYLYKVHVTVVVVTVIRDMFFLRKKNSPQTCSSLAGIS
jgi:hypothetical protein